MATKPQLEAKIAELEEKLAAGGAGESEQLEELKEANEWIASLVEAIGAEDKESVVLKIEENETKSALLRAAEKTLKDASEENLSLKEELRIVTESAEEMTKLIEGNAKEGKTAKSCKKCADKDAKIEMLLKQLEIAGGAKIEALKISKKDAAEKFVSSSILKDYASANVAKQLIATPSKDGRTTTLAIVQGYGGQDELVKSGTFAAVAEAGLSLVAKYGDAIVEIERGKAVFVLPLKAFIQ